MAHLENYHLSVAAHEDALREAGFRTVRWHEPRVSPEGEGGHGPAFWKPFLGASPITFIESVTAPAPGKDAAGPG